MDLYLKNVTFDSDIFSIDMPDGNVLVLNKIEESLRDTVNFIGDFEVNRINIEVMTETESIPCSSIIGLDTKYYKIVTSYKELEGKVLTAENMQYCTISIYE